MAARKIGKKKSKSATKAYLEGPPLLLEFSEKCAFLSYSGAKIRSIPSIVGLKAGIWRVKAFTVENEDKISKRVDLSKIATSKKLLRKPR